MQYLAPNGVKFLFSKEWSTQIGLTTTGRLPSIEFRLGGMELHLPDFDVKYMDGTESRFDSKAFFYIRGRWSLNTTSSY